MSDFWGDRGDALMAKARTSPLFSAKDDRLRTNKAGPIRLAQEDDTRKATGRAEATAKCGVPFDFAQGRLLHYATNDETVRRFGRDDAFYWRSRKKDAFLVEQRRRLRVDQKMCGRCAMGKSWR